MVYTCSNKIAEDSLQDVVTFALDPKIKEEFKTLVASEPAAGNLYQDQDTAMQVMQVIGKKLELLLPSNIQEILRKMSRTGEPGIIYFKGLPTDYPIPEKEDIIERVNAKSKVSECLMLGLAYIMRCEVSPNNEQGGRIIHNIAPVNGHENTFSSKGIEPFYLHTDNAYQEKAPDFVMMYSLAQDPNVSTSYYLISDFIEFFPKDILESMKKKQFKIKSAPGYSKIEGIFALLSEEEDIAQNKKLRLRLYQEPRGRIEAASEEVREEVEKVIQAIESILKPINPNHISLKPGEAIIFNNGWGINKVGGVMHGRKGKITNLQRWLQRAFLFKR